MGQGCRDIGEEGRCALDRVWRGQLHLGSIEGLAWQDQVDGGSLATVGADCVVNLFRLVYYRRLVDSVPD